MEDPATKAGFDGKLLSELPICMPRSMLSSTTELLRTKWHPRFLIGQRPIRADEHPGAPNIVHDRVDFRSSAVFFVRNTAIATHQGVASHRVAQTFATAGQQDLDAHDDSMRAILMFVRRPVQLDESVRYPGGGGVRDMLSALIVRHSESPCT